MSRVEVPPGALILGRIEVVHWMVDDDVQVGAHSVDSSGDQAGIVATLGLIETAKALIINDYHKENIE